MTKKQKLTVEYFLEEIRSRKTKGTYKEYKAGISKFVEFYGKSANEILEERRKDVTSGDFAQNTHFSRELEKFHKYLIEKTYSINSARNYCLGIRQLFRFYGFPLTNLSAEISQTVQTTKDFIPTIQQYRDMFNVADIKGKIIISMGLDVGWRIGDFVTIRKEQIPDLEQKAPISFDLVTQKEKVVAKSFLGLESIELLKTYLPTLPKENPYLFPANHDKHIDDETINYHLRELSKKAKIKIPEGKRLRFHCFRKRFLTTCADLKIDVNTAKILVGKDVESSMLAYLSEVDHAKAFLEVKEALSLSNGAIKETMQSKDTEIQKQQKQIDELRLILRGMTEIYGEDILNRAMNKLGMVAKHSGEPTEGRGLIIPDLGSISVEEPKDILELLKQVGKAKGDRDRAEYQKLIENGNGNGDSH